MNLSKLAPAWNQLKAVNGLTEISELEILAVTELQKSPTPKVLIKRVALNIFSYSFLILMLNGGCSI